MGQFRAIVDNYYFTSDQFTEFHAIVLEGLLEQETGLRPHEIMSDTAGYSDLVFGLFRLLGYQFSPGRPSSERLGSGGSTQGRLRGARRPGPPADQRRADRAELGRPAVSGRLAEDGGRQRLGADPRPQGRRAPSTLGRAIGELGRLAKTLYLLNYLDDEAYRRRILTQLNRGESRHVVARAIFHSQRGELRQRYREGQEDQLRALGLVVNAVVLWNTRYLDAALAKVRATDVAVKPEDVERLSPLQFDHVNMLGRYEFALKESILQGQLRPLREPSERDDLAV